MSTEQSQIGVKRKEEQKPRRREISGHDLNRRLLKNQNINTAEISSLVKIPRAPPASENRMHQKRQSFEFVSPRSQLKHHQEGAGFYHPVERERYHLTLPDIDNGKRKYHSYAKGIHTSSRIFLFQVFRNDQSDTKFGPVLNVHMSKLGGVHCIEVQVYRIILQRINRTVNLPVRTSKCSCTGNGYKNLNEARNSYAREDMIRNLYHQELQKW